MALIANKKARADYDFLDTFEAGIELFGHEVKSLKEAHGSLVSSYVVLSGGEAYLKGMHVPPYQAGNVLPSYNPYRERKLLLSKKELVALAEAGKEKGLTIIPVSVYNKGNKMKVEIAVARGRKKYDKREVIKKRDAEREIRRSLKS